MKPHATRLEGLYEVEPRTASDARGRFARLFCEAEFATVRPSLHFTQVNLSVTARRGTVRGMHYQRPPQAEAKLICCLRGRAFDVAVDVRRASATFLQWHAIELVEGGRCVFIPEGFAHGFQAATDDVQLLYMHTSAWSPDHECGLRYDDPRIAIEWPLAVTLVSEKDRHHPLIDDRFAGVEP